MINTSESKNAHIATTKFAPKLARITAKKHKSPLANKLKTRLLAQAHNKKYTPHFEPFYSKNAENRQKPQKTRKQAKKGKNTQKP